MITRRVFINTTLAAAAGIALSACSATAPATPQPTPQRPPTVRPAVNPPPVVVGPAPFIDHGPVNMPVNIGQAVYPNRTPEGRIIIGCPLHLFYMADRDHHLYEITYEMVSSKAGSGITLSGNIAWVGILHNYQPYMTIDAKDFDRIWPGDAKSELAEALAAYSDPSRHLSLTFTCQ